MEMKKRRQKTLTGLFLKFAALFCLDTFGIGMFCLVLLVLSPMTGFTLPANYAELQLTDHTEEIKAAGTDVEALIPDGFTMRRGGLRPELFWQTRRKGHGRGIKTAVSMHPWESITAILSRTAAISVL